ncbi:MAG: hypothetical protein IJC97_00090 [Oscillospiraceae bacterium]|nr:hypothetical protein [Oscillospiraceae bacterium]
MLFCRFWQIFNLICSAAAFEKVMRSSSSIEHGFLDRSFFKTRATNTDVLPLPAAAETSSEPAA